MNSVRSNNISLKYPRPTPFGCKDIRIRKFEFVAKTFNSFARSSKVSMFKLKNLLSECEFSNFFLLIFIVKILVFYKNLDRLIIDNFP